MKQWYLQQLIFFNKSLPQGLATVLENRFSLCQDNDRIEIVEGFDTNLIQDILEIQH